MTEIKISELTAKSEIDADDLLVIVDTTAGETKKIVGSNLSTLPYSQGGTGAVARTVKSKLQERVSVKDFGAAGDGSTDDTAAVQAALDASSHVMGVAGETYRCTSAITMNDGNVLDLNGSTLNFEITGTVKCLDMADNSVVKNGSIDLEHTTPSGSGEYGCPVLFGNYDNGAGVTNAEARDLIITSNRSDGNGILVTGSSSGIVIDNIHFPTSSTLGRCILVHWGNASQAGVWSTPSTHPTGVKITNITAGSMTLVNASDDAAVVFISASDNISIDGIHCDQMANGVKVFAGDYGYSGASAAQQKEAMSNIVVRNVHMEECDNLFFVSGLPAVSGSALDIAPVFEDSSAVSSQTSEGCIIVQYSKRGVIRNCKVRGGYYCVVSGIDAQAWRIEGGEYSHAQLHGIMLQNATTEPDDWVIDGAYVHDNGQVLTNSAGIYVRGSRTQILNCRMTDGSTGQQVWNIRLDTSSSATTIRNLISESGIGISAGSSGTTGLIDVYEGCVALTDTLYSGATETNTQPFYRYTSSTGVERNIVSKIAEIVSVKDFGAVGDGVTDDTAAIQAAIDYVAGLSGDAGGTVHFPRGKYVSGQLTIKNRVNLLAEGYTSGAGYRNKTVFLQPSGIADDAFFIVDERGGTTIRDCAIAGFSIYGGGSTSKYGCIQFLDFADITIDGCHIDNFGLHAFTSEGETTAGRSHFINSTFRGCYNQAYMVTLADETGAVDITGADHNFVGCEFYGPNTGSVSDANLYLSAILVDCDNSTFTACIAQTADIGWNVQRIYNRFVGCRGDLNAAHGWFFDGSLNVLTGCHAHNNSADTDNTYDGFNFSGGSQNILSGCLATNSSGGNKQRYGFYDNRNSETFRNYFTDCLSIGHKTAQFSFNSARGAASWSAPGKGFFTFTDLDATPDVSGGENFYAAYTVSTNITNFDGGANGQTIRVHTNTTNQTFVHGSTIKTNTGSNVTSAADRIYTFTRDAGVWYMH